LHIEVEIVCTKKSLVTASYVSDAMQELDEAAKANNLIFMNEIDSILELIT
jgi:predicted translin family RNA/ssDNA-binding protein